MQLTINSDFPIRAQKTDQEDALGDATEKEPVTPWICLISRLSMLFVGREMSRIGFGSGHFFLLSELYDNEGLSQDELSRRVGFDKSNTSRAIAKLEEYGLVRRENDRENHRIRRIFLTAKAHRIREEFTAIQNRLNHVLLKGFSKEEKNRFLADLKNMGKNAAAFFDEQGIFQPK